MSSNGTSHTQGYYNQRTLDSDINIIPRLHTLQLFFFNNSRVIHATLGWKLTLLSIASNRFVYKYPSESLYELE